MISLLSRNKTYATVIKRYTKADITIFKSCPMLLNFLVNQIFWTRLVNKQMFAHNSSKIAQNLFFCQNFFLQYLISIFIKCYYVMSCAIWYHLHNSKNVKNPWRSVTFSKVAGLLKVTLLHGCFSRF